MTFDKIINSPYIPFFTNELWAISRSILSLEEKLHNTESYLKFKENNESRFISNNSEPHEIISSILGHSSRLDKLMHSANKRDSESDTEYEFRKDRSKFLRKMFLSKKKTTHEIFKAGVRNGIEHFDERIDLMCAKIIAKEKEINTKTLICNFTVSNTNCFDKWENVLPFKVFVIITGEYFMVDKNFNKQSILIYDLLDEVRKIEKKCADYFKKRIDENGNFSENPGGLLKVPVHPI